MSSDIQWSDEIGERVEADIDAPKEFETLALACIDGNRGVPPCGQGVAIRDFDRDLHRDAPG